MEYLTLFFRQLYVKFFYLLYDVLTIPVAWYLAYWIRFNFTTWPAAMMTADAVTSFFVVFVVQSLCFYLMKVYRGDWYYVSMNDLFRIIKAVLVAVLVVIPILYACALLFHLPRTVLPLFSLLLITLLSFGRIIVRAYKDRLFLSKSLKSSQRVLIIGAGSAGESLVRNLIRDTNYEPVAFLDDNKSKQGKELHGVRVLGSISALHRIARSYDVGLIFIAIPSATSALMRRILLLCEECHIPVRTLPSLTQLASGQVEVHDLRDVRLEDLLGRDPIELDWDKIAATIKNKRILVTGAGGSIGSELCRQIMRYSPSGLCLVDHSEINLYTIHSELESTQKNMPVYPYLVSVTDGVGLENVFKDMNPDIVFHAAAYKQVPLLETQIREAIQNNIMGTQILANLSVAYNVEKFIYISTDKAVNPASIMGATKRASELYCQGINAKTKTAFITVRFGNVLGSAGSVVPLFKQQLAQGGPITVTHPDIQRFFMTIQEASQLILQAMTNGIGGEIFVLDMGEPVNIEYLATQMIRLAGKIPGKDIEIKYIGLRPGEKLDEELFHSSETLELTEHEKLLKASGLPLDWSLIQHNTDLLAQYCKENKNINACTQTLKILVSSASIEINSKFDCITE